MALGEGAKKWMQAEIGRPISKAEALKIMCQNEADGLVLQPSNTQKVEYICSCCGCCCGMLCLQKMLPKPVDFWSSNYYAKVDTANCAGCQTCFKRCQMNAVKFDEDLGVSSVNLDRCIGCGNCVAACPSGAMSLMRKEKETIPPVDSEHLYDAIMAGKMKKTT
jgi:Pyruvate/2-oxoacid:ferredoxin oxidoreductase delta subunit